MITGAKTPKQRSVIGPFRNKLVTLFIRSTVRDPVYLAPPKVASPFRATLLWNITAGSKRVLAGGPRPPPACLRHSRQACPGCCAHFPFGLRRRFHRGRAFDSSPPCSGSSGDSGAGSRTHFTLFLQWCAIRGLSHGSQNLSEVLLERFDPLFEVGGLSKLSW